MADALPQHATAGATRAFADRSDTADGHFRTFDGLTVSSIGIGTYLGALTHADDAAYEAAVARALSLGINVVDTAINYRHQRSERCVGRALRRAIADGAAAHGNGSNGSNGTRGANGAGGPNGAGHGHGLARDQVVVATKGGFLSFDGERAPNPRAYIQERFFDRGVMTPADVVRGCHCMTPAYLADQIATSRRNLGLDTIDLYYLHNPEIQLTAVDRDTFRTRIRTAFEALEQAVADGHIRAYGTATWSGYRVPADHAEHLDLAELVAIAAEVGGAGHHFRAVQLPYSMAMYEAATVTGQRLGDRDVTLLEAAAELGVYVMCSASIFQGELAEGLSPALATPLPGLSTDAQRALQFARSTPGVGTALVGMKAPEHVDDNCAVAGVDPAETTAIAALLYMLETADGDGDGDGDS